MNYVHHMSLSGTDSSLVVHCQENSCNMLKCQAIIVQKRDKREREWRSTHTNPKWKVLIFANANRHQPRKKILKEKQ